jgi:elongation factor G
MARKLENIRNIGIIAHIDAGKTTVTEQMLYISGMKHRVGKVDSGTTTTDEDPEEQERGITIYSACVTFDWKDIHINLLDTPGHVDFTAEVERSLRVLDGAVVVFSAREGVQAQSETVWRQADKYGVPRVAFINKLDREGASFERVLKEMKLRLNAHPLPIQIPVGLGPAHFDDPFRGVIDLIEMRMLTFDEEGRKMNDISIPGEFEDIAQVARHELLEELYNFSDEMAQLAMAEEPIPVELVRSVIRQATLERLVQPVVCGSALHGMGVQGVLDSVKHYLPSPLDRPPVQGANPVKTDLVEIRKPDPKAPFCGLVFKILPAKTGDLYWIRIYSGTLPSNSRVFCPGKDKKENIAQLWQIYATKKDRDGQLETASCGEIVGVIGPRYAVTGDTLCDQKAPILLESIEFPETVIQMAIEPDSTAERKKLSETLELLKRQDPTFKARENEETGQTLIEGMGELHLEVIKNRLLRDFNLKVKVHKPRVSYRETVSQAAQVTGECHRLYNGLQLFAKLTLRMEPDAKAESGVAIRNQLPMEVIPPEMVQNVKDEIMARGGGGGSIGGFPLTKLRVTLINAETNEFTTPMAISIAAGDAFEKGLHQAGPLLMEPIMKLTVSTPEEYLGDFLGDLAQRRAQVVSTDNLAEITTIVAHAPLAELFGYSNAMRSLSQGRAGSSMEPLEYAPAPDAVAQSFAL